MDELNLPSLRKNICIKKLMRQCAQTIRGFLKKLDKFHKISEISIS
jgi:hypothetical protein